MEALRQITKHPRVSCWEIKHFQTQKYSTAAILSVIVGIVRVNTVTFRPGQNIKQN